MDHLCLAAGRDAGGFLFGIVSLMLGDVTVP
ncbi:hypothetical protein LCGC14_2166600, partial [marine sediment metagenome]